MMQAAARGVVLSSRTTSSSASLSSHTKRVFIEISNAVLRSNIRWRGRSFATSVASDSIKPQKGQKKMSKQERRAMLESFVDKYRASNAGKFPTVSHARQQVGGSYYTVRQIIQELEYNSKVGPVKKIAEVQLKKVEKIIHPSSHATGKSSFPIIEEISSSVTTPSCSPQTQSSESEVDSSLSVKSGTTVDISHSPPGEIERSRKDISSAEFLQDTHDPKGVKQIGDREDTKSEDFNGDHPKRFEHGESSTKGSNIWGNLKSFADGIINFWKKM